MMIQSKVKSILPLKVGVLQSTFARYETIHSLQCTLKGKSPFNIHGIPFQDTSQCCHETSPHRIIISFFWWLVDRSSFRSGDHSSLGLTFERFESYGIPRARKDFSIGIRMCLRGHISTFKHLSVSAHALITGPMHCTPFRVQQHQFDRLLAQHKPAKSGKSSEW